MKTLQESILDSQDVEQKIEKDEKKVAAHIAYTKFKSDIESILTNAGWKIAKGFLQSDSIQTVFVDRIREQMTSGTVEVDRYNMHYALESDIGKRFGYIPSCIGFDLVLYVWKDPELNRPRYRFETFRLNDWNLRTGGYKLDWNETFGAKKVVPEHYDKALSHIRGIVRDFVDGFLLIDKMWAKTVDRNPQKADFIKIKNSLFKNKITKQ